MQLALVSMITITVISSLSVFFLKRTGLFRTRGEQGRTRGEQGLYFEMLRRIICSLFRGCRMRTEAEKPKTERVVVNHYGVADRLPVSAGNFGRVLQRHFSVDFQTKISLERSFPFLNAHVLLL